MTASQDAVYIEPAPDVIPARSTIEHVQLRDILQPSTSKGKCLILNRLKIDEVDFNNTQKGQRTFCTLDFRANCLATAHGLLAAGGQSSELAIRPLIPPSHCKDGRGDEESDSDDDQWKPSRSSGAWLLRTPTGGSINNSISIHIDPSAIANYKTPTTLSSPPAPSSSSQPTSKKQRRHSRLPQGHPRGPPPPDGVWLRDEPIGRGLDDPQSHASSSRSDMEMAIDLSDSDGEASIFDDGGEEVKWGRTAIPSPAPPVHRVYVSNNDQTLKIFKLRPPSGASGMMGDSSSASGKKSGRSGGASNAFVPHLEGGLPGLSRSYTITFPTAVNHTSLSPDGRSLVAVGDTPDVFLYHRHDDGFFTKTATYQATSDASFSTSWHPDGTKFAVASQDGVISVWDVRSKKKLAEIKTAQSSTVGLLTSNGADGAARVVKFSPCGRFLAFTEHRLYFHIYDTQTYSKGQKIRVPISVTDGAGNESSGEGAAAGDSRIRRRQASRPSVPPHHPYAFSPFPESGERNAPAETGARDRSFWRQLHLSGGGPGEGAGPASTSAPTRWSLDRASFEAEELNSGGGGSGDEIAVGTTASATENNPDSAVRALRDAQRSLRSVRERLAYRAFQQVQREREQSSLRRGSVIPRTSSITTVERAALHRALAEGWQPQAVLDEAGAGGGAEDQIAGGDEDIARERAQSEEAGSSNTLPMLRAYSALYSPLGPLSGWPDAPRGSTTTTTSSRLEEPLDRQLNDGGNAWLPSALPSLARSIPSPSSHIPFGSIGGLSAEEEAWHNISGLCWDPSEDGDCLYVATERLVCRYRIRELRRGSERGDVC
ncbi:hypothetical protein BDZ90DRAFT_232214 [Jaminaea rosea]|uniref:DUF2415 domain-containing protein n=1 Tax=Jaminaea rosea TaxID=1569628 RepID=A0A316UR90_9BASI|nr:hypothetical protein BDZ90DRAFT_232214 [Jaminaea rosea]PWN27830.1 hypothetical protein BDZ90DRAFT_232214 [Jaminaea rosea]